MGPQAWGVSCEEVMSLPTKNPPGPWQPLQPSPSPSPPALQIQCQPANSAKHITAQTIAPEHQTASRTMHRDEHSQWSNPTSFQLFSSFGLWPAPRILMPLLSSIMAGWLDARHGWALLLL